jgi:hypothetical protein
MAYMSERFNFDDFDKLVGEALEEYEEAASEFDRVFYPGEVGGVVCRPSFEIEVVEE